MTKRKPDKWETDFAKRVFGYAKEAGIKGFKNGEEVIAALQEFSRNPKNRQAVTEMLRESETKRE